MNTLFHPIPVAVAIADVAALEARLIQSAVTVSRGQEGSVRQARASESLRWLMFFSLLNRSTTQWRKHS
ncbi:hypothetical protein [Aeromonas hydrophila]|uniref:hypothetical protein n=1 Tax=Aeromonas hydrophila TaxID=644 RepID=UPI002B476AC4|nr:hypothetical protein [Aeromonas hydrophila]